MKEFEDKVVDGPGTSNRFTAEECTSISNELKTPIEVSGQDFDTGNNLQLRNAIRHIGDGIVFNMTRTGNNIFSVDLQGYDLSFEKYTSLTVFMDGDPGILADYFSNDTADAMKQPSPIISIKFTNSPTTSDRLWDLAESDINGDKVIYSQCYAGTLVQGMTYKIRLIRDGALKWAIEPLGKLPIGRNGASHTWYDGGRIYMAYSGREPVVYFKAGGAFVKMPGVNGGNSYWSRMPVGFNSNTTSDERMLAFTTYGAYKLEQRLYAANSGGAATARAYTDAKHATAREYTDAKHATAIEYVNNNVHDLDGDIDRVNARINNLNSAYSVANYTIHGDGGVYRGKLLVKTYAIGIAVYQISINRGDAVSGEVLTSEDISQGDRPAYSISTNVPLYGGSEEVAVHINYYDGKIYLSPGSSGKKLDGSIYWYGMVFTV